MEQPVINVTTLLESQKIAIVNAIGSFIKAQNTSQMQEIMDIATKASHMWAETYLPTLLGEDEAQRMLHTVLREGS